jgi:hypothetical protein
MPRALPNDLYEHLLTTTLAQDLEALESRQPAVAALDLSNSHKALASIPIRAPTLNAHVVGSRVQLSFEMQAVRERTRRERMHQPIASVVR